MPTHIFTKTVYVSHWWHDFDFKKQELSHICFLRKKSISIKNKHHLLLYILKKIVIKKKKNYYLTLGTHVS